MENVFKLENEHHKFMNNLSQINKHFLQDIEQIELLIREVEVPTEIKKDSTESSLKIYKKHLLKARASKDKKVYVNNGGEVIEFPEEMLEYIVEVMTNKLIVKERNLNFKKSIAFIHLVTLLDAALVDLLRQVLNNNISITMPFSTKSGKVCFDSSQSHISYMEILNSSSIGELKNEMIERRLDKFGRKSIEEQISFFERILRTEFQNSFSMTERIFTYDEELSGKDFKQRRDAHESKMIELLVEIVETRNIHVHNRGMVNNIYLSKTTSALWSAHGIEYSKYREITDAYLSESVKVCREFVISLAKALTKKFTSEESRKAIKERSAYWKERTANAKDKVNKGGGDKLDV